MRNVCIAAVFCVLASSVGGSAAPFTLYSDVCYHRTSGDIRGTRIGILRLPEGRYLYLQFAEGDFVAPQMIVLTPQDLQSGQLTFSARIMAKGPQSTFHGRITDNALTGAFDNVPASSENQHVKLRRISPDKKGFPDCK